MLCVPQAYLNKLAAHHAVLVAAMKAKQTMDEKVTSRGGRWWDGMGCGREGATAGTHNDVNQPHSPLLVPVRIPLLSSVAAHHNWTFLIFVIFLTSLHPLH